jgi:purine catabolism regulator
MGMSEIYRLRERERNRGERLLEDLLRGGSDAGLVAHELDEAGFETPGRAVLVALGASDDPLAQVDEIDHRLHDADVPHLIARLDAIYLLLEDVAPLDGSAPFGGLAIGVSRPMGDVATGGPLARREALWSLERARANKAGSLVRFDEPGYAHWLPPDLSALEQLVEVYLGPVFAYDREHQADLAATLATFFRHQRKLGPAAKELFVHKNTLTYRLHQIEDLCGRDPTDLEQQTQMWLALKALAVVDSGRVAADERLLV